MTGSLLIRRRPQLMMARAFWLTASGALFALVTFVTYGPAVRFSFLLDDCDAILSVLRTPYQDLLLTRHDGGYYRPLTFVLFKLLADLTRSTPSGGVSPVPYHVLEVTLHALNSFFLTALAARWVGRWPATLAGLLFLVFPFSYQAVEIVGATAHLLATAAVSLMLLCWFRARRAQGRSRTILLICATLAGASAPGFHETGVLALPVFIVACLIGASSDRQHRRDFRCSARRLGLPWSAIVAGAHLLYFAIWLHLPNGRPLAVTDVLPNSIVWLQAATFPVTRLLTLRPLPLSARPFLLVSAIGSLTLALTLALARIGRTARLAALSLVCSAAAFVPSALSLSAAYVANGPRLLYTAAPGIALYWATLVAATSQLGRARRLLTFALLSLVVLALVQSVVFLRTRTEMGRVGSEVQEGVVTFVADHPGTPIAVIDAPTYFLPRRPEFPLGNLMHHAQAHFHGFDKLVAVRLGLSQQRPVLTLITRSDDDSWPYRVAYHGRATSLAELTALQRTGWAIAVVDFEQGHVRVSELTAGAPRHGF